MMRVWFETQIYKLNLGKSIPIIPDEIHEEKGLL